MLRLSRHNSIASEALKDEEQKKIIMKKEVLKKQQYDIISNFKERKQLKRKIPFKTKKKNRM